jgi:hypothetical protein
MNRTSASPSKLLKKKWDDRNLEIHQKKILNVRSSLRTSSTKCQSTSRINNKRFQQQEGNFHSDRYTQIEKDNRVLLERMSSINKSRSVATLPFTQRARSMNDAKQRKRKRDLVEITMNNYRLLRRLQQSKSVYSANRFENDRREQERRLKQMCEFPYRLGVTDESRIERGSTTQRLNMSQSSKQLDHTSFYYVM